MNSLIKIKKFVVSVFFFFALNANACDVVDDAGHAIRLKHGAQRIISLAPDITETLFAIGAGNKIVGVMRGSDYPPQARSLPLIGSYNGIDLEKIIALHPDLIVTWGHLFSRELNALKKLGIPIYITTPRRLEDIPRTMINLGCLAGTEPIASQAAKKFMHQLTTLHARYHWQQSLRVFYQIGSYSLLTINKESWINQVITLCGGRNVFADAQFITPEIGWEALLTANPQVIISDATQPDWKKRWQAWSTIAAIKNQFLFAIQPDLIDRASPRLLIGAQQMCEYLARVRHRTSKNYKKLKN